MLLVNILTLLEGSQLRRDPAGVAGVTWVRDVSISSQGGGQGTCNSLECFG